MDLQNSIAAGERVLGALGPDFRPTASQLRDLAARWDTGEFHLAVLGQFKRGKSTLINALLGETILPSAVIPATAVATRIRAGARAEAEVHFQDGRVQSSARSGNGEELTRFLADYVTEEGNPQNARCVARVDLHHPSPVLRAKVVLIDTPGVGSTFRHNTEATLALLPECDAALFVVSADPPLTEVEAEFLRQVRRHVSRLVFVLNKVDYLAPVELDEATRFLRRVLSEQGLLPDEAPIFHLSARDALRSHTAGDGESWRRSGADALRAYLVDFLAREKATTLRTSIGAKAADLIGAVLLRLDLTLRSAELSVQQLQERLTAFEQKLPEIVRARRAFQDLLAGDKRRAAKFVEAEYARVVDAATRSLHLLVDDTLGELSNPTPDETNMNDALSRAAPGLFGGLFAEVSKNVEDHLRNVLSSHEAPAIDLINAVRRTAGDVFGVPFDRVALPVTFDRGRPPHWRTHVWERSVGPLSSDFLGGLLPRGVRRAWATRRFHAKVEELVRRNAGELRQALATRVDEAFARFIGQLDVRLREATDTTRGVIAAVVAERQRQTTRARAESERMRTAADELRTLKERLVASDGDAAAPAPSC